MRKSEKEGRQGKSRRQCSACTFEKVDVYLGMVHVNKYSFHNPSDLPVALKFLIMDLNL